MSMGIDFLKPFYEDQKMVFLRDYTKIRVPRGILNKVKKEGVGYRLDYTEGMLSMVDMLTRYKFSSRRDEWVNVHSGRLIESFGRNYKNMINSLKSVGLIEANNSYSTDRYTKSYRLSKRYRDDSSVLVDYKIKSQQVLESRKLSHDNLLKRASEDVIAVGLLDTYKELILPTSEELLLKGKELVKGGFITKKRKILTMRNKHSTSYWSDNKERSFVEDNIKLYEFLTHNGLLIPRVGSERSGGRIVDSLTLMPSWIRNEITMVNELGEEAIPTKELDFSSLHPNIAQVIYGSKSKVPITHDKVAEVSGLSRDDAKLEHLSFLNKRVGHMKKSLLFKFYEQEEPDLLKNLINAKYNSIFGHRITSMELMGFEVNMMRLICKEFQDRGILYLYVYDALLVNPLRALEAAEIMNSTTERFGVKSWVETENL